MRHAAGADGWAAVGLTLLAALACALPAALGPPLPVEPLRIRSVAHAGDATRRASTHLVLDGLDADAAARPAAALQLYERSLQLDPTNPWAYLALARHRAEGPDPEQALPALDQAEVLLRREAEPTPGCEVHLVGLRGAALLAAGRGGEGLPLLRRARELAPSVWNDGRLEARELR